MSYISVFDLIVLGLGLGVLLIEMLQNGKSNCILWAAPRWLRRGIAGEETYLCFRITRVKYGVLHCLLGERDPTRYRLNMTSYRPPPGHVKTGFAPVFKGDVVTGDAPDHP